MDLPPLRKDFYTEHESVKMLSQQQVARPGTTERAEMCRAIAPSECSVA